MDILVGLLCIGLGLTLVLGGYRLARFIIPLWGFLTGLAVGGSIISAMSDMPFLGATLGIIVGVLLGGIFALFAYLYYAVAIIILFGSLGYWLGSSFITMFGLDKGLLSILTGTAIGLVAAVVALASNAPKYVLVIVTAMAGALATIGGLMLTFSSSITVDTFSFEHVNNSIQASGLWTLFAIMLSVIGIVAQSLMNVDYELEEWTMGHEPSGHHLPPAATHMTH